jgi:hypothetical protein
MPRFGVAGVRGPKCRSEAAVEMTPQIETERRAASRECF